MLKRNITFTNPFTEQEVTEEHYFHLSKADMAEIQLVENKTKYTNKDGKELEGWEAKLTRIIESQDGKAILAEFKDLIQRSYGRKVGDRFIKNAEVWDEFASSEAYSQLLFEVCTNAEKAAEFFNGIVPADIAKQAAAELSAQQESPTAAAGLTAVPDEQREPVESFSSQVPGTHAWVEKRKPVIDAATPENPVDINRDDVTLMTPNALQSGLADGRYKLS